MERFAKYVRRPISIIFMACVIFSLISHENRIEYEYEMENVAMSGKILKVQSKKAFDSYDVGKYLVLDFSKGCAISVGDTVNVSGRLKPTGAFYEGDSLAYGRYLSGKGYAGVVYANDIVITNQAGGFSYYCHEIRNKLYSTIENLFKKKHGGLLKGMLFGDKAGIPKQRMEMFSETGVTHIFAVSGIHIGIIFFMMMIFLKDAGDFARVVLSSFALFAYACICGFTPSVTRAVIFFILIGISYLVQREYDVMCALYTVGILLVFQNPDIIYDISFQLSFAAVASISSFYRPICKRIGIRPMALSVSASILTWPIIYMNFGVVSVISPIANLLTVPLLPFVIGFSYCAIAASFVANWAAALIAGVVGIILDYYVWVCGLLHGTGISALHFEYTNAKLVVIYYFVMAYYIVYKEVKSVKEQENAAKGYEKTNREGQP